MAGTLKGKISMVYLSLVLVTAIVGAVSVINLYGLSKAINGLMIKNYTSINVVNNMMEAIERQDSAMLTYINVNRQKGIDLFTDNDGVFSGLYDTEHNNITEPGEQEHVDKIGTYYQQYIKSFSELQEILNNQGTEQATAYYNTMITPNFIQLKEEMKELAGLNERAMFGKKNAVTNNAKQSMYFLFGISVVAVIGGFLLSRFFANRFLKPIYTLTQAIKLVKAGNLNKQIDVTSTDEVGMLAKEFNNMTKRLQEYERSTLGKLLEEKNKSLAIVKSISDPLIVLDTDFRIILLNNAFEKFFNVQENEVMNKHFLEAIRNNEMFEYISGALDMKEDYKEKIMLVQSDEDYYFNVVVIAIKDVDSNIAGFIAVFQNVTQLKKLEKIKTDFIGTISHEFKTPLTSIVMGTSMMLDESMGPLTEDQKSVMDTIRDDEIRLSNLVNELLEMSKIESDRAVFNIIPNSIEGIVETSVKQFYEQAEQKDVSLYYALDEHLPKVNADYEKITWAINNLITNALKFTGAGDEICVSAYVKMGKMLVSVKDTGYGIPEEFLEKIFGKFVQVKGQNGEVHGTGLGLAVVKEIVEAHGGEIWCESKLDVGSNFIFTLPLSKEKFV